jgi:hypothetical protein
MTDHQANDSASPDFEEAAEKSEAANIADESASYTNAIERTSKHTSNEPQSPDQRPEAMDDE